MISCQLIGWFPAENSLRQVLVVLPDRLSLRDLDFRNALWLGLEGKGHAIDDLGPWRFWPEASQSKQFFDGGYPPHHIFETRFIRLIVRHVFDRRCALSALFHLQSEVFERDLFGVANVGDFSHGPVGIH